MAQQSRRKSSPLSSKSRRPTTPGAPPKDGLREGQLRAFDDLMLQGPRALAPAPTSSSTPRTHSTASSPGTRRKARGEDAKKVLFRSESIRRLTAECVQRASERLAAAKGQRDAELHRECSFTPTLSPFVQRQRAKARRDQEKAEQRRRTVELLHLDGAIGSEGIGSSFAVRSRASDSLKGKEGQRKKLTEPPAESPHQPKLTPKGSLTTRSLEDLFHWEQRRRAKVEGSEEGDGGPPSAGPSVPRLMSTDERRFEAERKECSFSPKLSRRSLVVVDALGDRRIDCVEHALMHAAARGREAQGEITKRMDEKAADIGHQSGPGGRSARRDSGATEASAADRLQRFRAQQAAASEMQWWLQSIRSDVAYRSNAVSTQRATALPAALYDS